MTLTVTTTHTDGVILATDRRLMHLLSFPYINYTHSSRVFIEGYQKVFKFNPPHNWVGIAISGSSGFDFHILVEKISANLPDQRLTIEEYVNAIYDFYLAECNQIAEQALEHPLSNPGVITIAGISPQRQMGEIYVICPERNERSPELSQERIVKIETGDMRHLKEAEQIYFEDLLGRLIIKQTELEQLNLDLADKELSLLATLREQKFEESKKLLDFPEIIEFTKSLIKNTAHEQLRLDVAPGVGENIDLIIITEENGSELTSDYENKNYFLADTNKHNITVICCDTETIIQLNPQNLDITLPNNYIKFPEDFYFTCNECNRIYDLFELVQDIENCLQTNFQ
jgi:hypothetical protein